MRQARVHVVSITSFSLVMGTTHECEPNIFKPNLLRKVQMIFLCSNRATSFNSIPLLLQVSHSDEVDSVSTAGHAGQHIGCGQKQLQDLWSEQLLSVSCISVFQFSIVLLIPCRCYADDVAKSKPANRRIKWCPTHSTLTLTSSPSTLWTPTISISSYWNWRDLRWAYRVALTELYRWPN